MLVEFCITNFRSIKEIQVFSMVASSDRTLATNTIESESLGKLRLNRSAVVYGANASGKSNLVAALEFVRNVVQGSGTRSIIHETREGYAADTIPITPFLLDPANRQEPSEFELIFIQKGVRYQYGFRIDRSRIHAEWLIAYPHGQPQRWFERTLRDDGTYEWSFRSKQFRGEKQLITEVTRSDALYLSVGPAFKLEQLTEVQDWFRNLRVYKPSNRPTRSYSYTAQRAYRDPIFHQRVRELLIHADVGIVDFTVEELPAESYSAQLLPDEEQPDTRHMRYEVTLAHQGTPAEKPVLLPFREESLGTQQFFEIARKWIDALDRGHVLVVDELDASLHPLLTRRLVELFHDPQINRKNAQLIFNTHDVTLLDKAVFRRDQIWFTEKDREGATHIYSLLEFSPRKEDSLSKGYLQGRYGAIPFIEDLGDWLTKDVASETGTPEE